MHDHALRGTLSSIAAEAVPETTDLWPDIRRRLADGVQPTRPSLPRRRVVLVTAAALFLMVGWTLGGGWLPGQSGSAQAAELARHDPTVAAALHGDIADVTVANVVDQVATVVVRDGTGHQVTVTVDLVHQIVTRVDTGPVLAAGLQAQALSVVRTDPRSAELLARGATIGHITPISVQAEKLDAATGKSTMVAETWAQVFIALGGAEWVAYVDLNGGKIDQLVDPQGNQVPLP